MFGSRRETAWRSAAVCYLAMSAALLGCGNTSGGSPPDGGAPAGCASTCTITLTGDGDDDDTTEVPGGQATFPCDDLPIATYNTGGGAVPAGFVFIVGRSGRPDISLEFSIAGKPGVGSYGGSGSEVAYLVTGAGGPEYVSDPALGGSSTLTFCAVAEGQTFGTSISYTVHGSVQAVLAPWTVTGLNAVQGPVKLLARF